MLCDDYIGCKEAGDNDDFHRSRHNDKRFIRMLLGCELFLDIYIKQEHLLNRIVKLSVLFLALYLALYAQYYEMCQNVYL